MLMDWQCCISGFFVLQDSIGFTGNRDCDVSKCFHVLHQDELSAYDEALLHRFFCITMLILN